ncbi:hypothetical protein D3C75_832460 [compost metagenome]
MAERHLLHQRLRDCEPARRLLPDADNQRQHVKIAPAALPAELAADCRKGIRGRIAAAGLSVFLRVSGIPDQLMVPDPDGCLRFPAAAEHGHYRTDTAAVAGPLQMPEQRFSHLKGRLSLAGIYDLQGMPEQPADTAAVIPPGHFGTVRELFRCMMIGSRLSDFIMYCFYALVQLSR